MDPGTCLAPDVINPGGLPSNYTSDVTNTSIEVWWTKPDLQECCYNVVFSYPLLMYSYKFMDEILPSEVCMYISECIDILYLWRM